MLEVAIFDFTLAMLDIFSAGVQFSRGDTLWAFTNLLLAVCLIFVGIKILKTNKK